MNFWIPQATSFAIHQSYLFTRLSIQLIKFALISLAITGISLLILVVAVVTNIGIPVWIIINKPRYKNYFIYAQPG